MFLRVFATYCVSFIFDFVYSLARPTMQNTYESPHVIDTDTDQCLMVWPMAEGRDVNVSIKDHYLALEVKLSPLAYDAFVS